MRKKYWERGLIIGFILGIVLLVINTLLAGIPMLLLFETPLGMLTKTLTDCVGEGCWRAAVIVGDIVLFLITPLFGVLIGSILDKISQKKK